jgi:hypothetical protein
MNCITELIFLRENYFYFTIKHTYYKLQIVQIYILENFLNKL